MIYAPNPGPESNSGGSAAPSDWNAGTVTSIGTNLALSGGTLSASGTITGGVTVAADSLFGNSGTVSAAGSSVAIGAGLTMSGGTIAASGGGSETPFWNVTSGVPLLSSFTEINFPSGNTTIEQYGTRNIILIQDLGSNTYTILKGLTLSAPAAPYRVAMFFRALIYPSGNNPAIEFGWSNGTAFETFYSNLGNLVWGHETWTNSSSRASAVNLTPNVPPPSNQPSWIGLRDDGTNIHVELSPDGVSWNPIPIYTIAKASGFLGTTGYIEIFWGCNPDSSSNTYYELFCYNPAA